MKNEKRSEVLFTDMKSVFEPKSALSPDGDQAHWRIVEYEGREFSGSLLTAFEGAVPQDVCFSPNLHGVYRISVLILSSVGCQLYLGMTGDKGVDLIKPTFRTGYAKTVEEIYWRTEEMEGKSITLTKRLATEGQFPFLAGFRFTPITDEEERQRQKERERRDTKRLYASDDTHNIFYWRRVRDENDVVSVLRPLAESDAEWFSFEDIRGICQGSCALAPDSFGFFREGDKRIEEKMSSFDFEKAEKALCAEAREMGIKPCISFRMGAWGMQFPFNKYYFDLDFVARHPEWRCVTRDGKPIDYLSYAYPGVRRFFLDKIVRGASYGADAVCLIAHRAPPFLLFEKPVADRFRAEFGYDPYRLPMNHPDLCAVHCEIMEEYFAELREALDKAFGKNRVQIHLRTSFSLADSKTVGLDCEALARKKLVDAIIPYPHRQYESLDPSVFDEDGLINIEKYKASAEDETTTVVNLGDFGASNFRAPYPDGKGGLIGPATLGEAVDEWVSLSRQTGVPVYFDMMPRILTGEKWDEALAELESRGMTRFAMWDSYERTQVLSYWNHIKYCCHDKTDGRNRFDEGYAVYHLKKVDGIDVGRYLPIWGG